MLAGPPTLSSGAGVTDFASPRGQHRLLRGPGCDPGRWPAAPGPQPQPRLRPRLRQHLQPGRRLRRHRGGRRDGRGAGARPSTADPERTRRDLGAGRRVLPHRRPRRAADLREPGRVAEVADRAAGGCRPRRHDREGAGQSPPLGGRVGGRVLPVRRPRGARDRRGVHHGRGAAPQERHPDGRGSSPLLRHPAGAVARGGRDPRRRHHLPRPDEHPALPGPADHGREGHGAAPRGPPGVGLGDR